MGRIRGGVRIPTLVSGEGAGLLSPRQGSSHELMLTGLLVQDPVVHMAPVAQDVATPGSLSTDAPYVDNRLQHHGDRTQGIVRSAEELRIALEEEPWSVFDEGAM